MARPLKQGVDYFPLDVYLDDKFKFVQIKYGLEGFAIIIKLLQKIYSCGYWYQWGEDEQLIFKNENHIDCETLKNVMNEAFKRDIFNQEMFDKYKILTSSGIQKRYKEIVRRRKDIEITTDYLLIDDIYQVNDDMLTTECKHNDDINTQRKGKERKGKESKGNKNETNTKQTNSEEHFELFYKQYPKKQGKATALKSWNKIKNLDFDLIMAALKEQKQSTAWRKDNGQFIPLPSTWLNQERWDDEVEVDINKLSSNPFKDIFLQEVENEKERNRLLNGNNQNSLPRILPPIE